jgi:hypothetical protein
MFLYARSYAPAAFDGSVTLGEILYDQGCVFNATYYILRQSSTKSCPAVNPKRTSCYQKSKTNVKRPQRRARYADKIKD